MTFEVYPRVDADGDRVAQTVDIDVDAQLAVAVVPDRERLRRSLAMSSILAATSGGGVFRSSSSMREDSGACREPLVLVAMAAIDLNDDERAALVGLLTTEIEASRFPLSPRVVLLRKV